jgi:hypothetical protein
LRLQRYAVFGLTGMLFRLNATFLIISSVAKELKQALSGLLTNHQLNAAWVIKTAMLDYAV